MVIELTLTICS